LSKTKVGDKVTVGQKYLRIGNTGSATTGSHLHATASKTVKGVFGATSAKVDLHKLILANAKGSAPKQANPKAKAVVQSKVEVKTVYCCPHCKKELK
jgi:murein DD-endopeptidase MepM/ murein hydrolase activator NlpD